MVLFVLFSWRIDHGREPQISGGAVLENNEILNSSRCNYWWCIADLSREVLELVSEVREVIAAGISDASCAIGVIDGVGEEDVLPNLNG